MNHLLRRIACCLVPLALSGSAFAQTSPATGNISALVTQFQASGKIDPTTLNNERAALEAAYKNATPAQKAAAQAELEKRRAALEAAYKNATPEQKAQIQDALAKHRSEIEAQLQTASPAEKAALTAELQKFNTTPDPATSAAPTVPPRPALRSDREMLRARHAASTTQQTTTP